MRETQRDSEGQSRGWPVRKLGGKQGSCGEDGGEAQQRVVVRKFIVRKAESAPEDNRRNRGPIKGAWVLA